MAEPGGSATIHGILYQVLVNLRRVAELRLDTELDGQEIWSARLILEPKGGEGDTRYEGICLLSHRCPWDTAILQTLTGKIVTQGLYHRLLTRQNFYGSGLAAREAPGMRSDSDITPEEPHDARDA